MFPLNLRNSRGFSVFFFILNSVRPPPPCWTSDVLFISLFFSISVQIKFPVMTAAHEVHYTTLVWELVWTTLPSVFQLDPKGTGRGDQPPPPTHPSFISSPMNSFTFFCFCQIKIEWLSLLPWRLLVRSCGEDWFVRCWAAVRSPDFVPLLRTPPLIRPSSRRRHLSVVSPFVLPRQPSRS